MNFISVFVISYLCGSIPFGLLIGKFNGIDIRLHGSHNIGATNVRRILGRDWGIACFLCDFLKGLLPVLFVSSLAGAGNENWGELLAVIGSICGHCFSVWLKFKGGKGVATSLGAVIGVSLWPVLGAALVWYLFFLKTRIVALASIAAAVAMPVISILMYLLWPGHMHGPAILLMTVIAALIVWRHKENIQRMMAGKENSFKKKA